VVLHDRVGGSSRDLHREFTAATTPALSSLSGQAVKGDWVLFVQDLAPADRGRLTSWSLDIGGRADNAIVVSDNPGTIIPDNQPAGIERTLNVAASGRLDSIEVDLDITHTFIGDLLVELFAPDNTSVPLHNRSGGATVNLIRTYTLLNTASLQTLRNREIKGNWRLRVADRAAVDQGKLNRWQLRLRTL
jgi:subtilisin-like proprotein convertase family protein